jgi:hypothetical protein
MAEALAGSSAGHRGGIGKGPRRLDPRRAPAHGRRAEEPLGGYCDAILDGEFVALDAAGQAQFNLFV